MDLYELGFRPLGSGLFGEVYAHPRIPNRVFKTGVRGDNWFQYIEWAALSGWAGSFAPKVYRVHKGRNFYGYLAEMERLSHERGGLHNAFVDKAANYRWNRNVHVPGPYAASIECFLKQFFYRFNEIYYNDIGYSNVLTRKVGDTYIPVLTDPFADSKPIPYSFNAMRTIKTAAYLPPSRPHRSPSHA